MQRSGQTYTSKSSPGLVQLQIHSGERLQRTSPDLSVPQRADTEWTTELKLSALNYEPEHLVCRPPWC